MNCKRCGANVPDFLWIMDDDHPVLIDHPIVVERHDDIEHNIVKITASARVERRLCSDVHPDKKESFLGLDMTTPIEEAVFTALGAASACWENLEGAGIFESDRCKKIGDELVEYFKAKGPIY